MSPAKTASSKSKKASSGSGSSVGRLVRRAIIVVLAIGLAYGAFAYFELPSVRAITQELGQRTPTQSAMMRARVAEAEGDGKALKLRQQFVPLARISNNLQKAVILSEDAAFWMHDGVDWGETRKAVAQAFEEGRLGRGGSTITQQLAKNMYLSERRSLVRKLQEWILAQRFEDALAKKRILELYLNFAEWGEGVFGAEMAARVHFGKSASALDPAEAAILTAMLPSPRTRDPRHPTRNLVHRAYKVADLMASVGMVGRDEIRARLATLVGPENSRRRGTTSAEK